MRAGVADVDVTHDPQCNWRSLLRCADPAFARTIVGSGVIRVSFRLLENVRDSNYFDGHGMHVFEFLRADGSAMRVHYHKNGKHDEPIYVAAQAALLPGSPQLPPDTGGAAQPAGPSTGGAAQATAAMLMVLLVMVIVVMSLVMAGMAVMEVMVVVMGAVVVTAIVVVGVVRAVMVAMVVVVVMEVMEVILLMVMVEAMFMVAVVMVIFMGEVMAAAEVMMMVVMVMVMVRVRAMVLLMVTVRLLPRRMMFRHRSSRGRICVTPP